MRATCVILDSDSQFEHVNIFKRHMSSSGTYRYNRCIVININRVYFFGENIINLSHN